MESEGRKSSKKILTLEVFMARKDIQKL